MSPMYANRLATSTSPYLLQHAANPVDWYPWGEEALQRARQEDKPIFLSVGYSACHWCHVMERESFENPEVAAVLNRYFVSIKVDREERPDLDDIYMAAVQAMTGRGGWPMSVWLTPDLKPFFGGTYFPLEPRFGFPGFQSLLENVATAWRERRNGVAEDAQRLMAALQAHAVPDPGHRRPDAQTLEQALAHLRRAFDPVWGGFGGAPKFPPVLSLDLLLQHGRPEDEKMVRRTLDGMAQGGLYDHLGGGFSRYSVDAQWRVPHFEKMLYDNAQLVSIYAKAFLRYGDLRDARVVRETLDYLLRDMQDEAGGFHSSEDADSEGEEGRFYVFTPREVEAVLGVREGERFCQAFGITPEGHLEGGGSVLHQPDGALDREALEPLLVSMRQARARRVRPRKDDKVLASWNGLAVSAFIHGFQALGEPRFLDAAQACGAFLGQRLWQNGVLNRVWRKGQIHTPGFLEDHASVALGFVDLHETTGDPCWLDQAQVLLEGMLDRFQDPEGGFFATDREQKDVILRMKPIWDHSLPSANALAVLALLRAGHHLDRQDFLTSAEKALVHFQGAIEQSPRGCLGLLQGLDWVAQGPLEVTIRGTAADPRVMALRQEAWRCPSSRRLIRFQESEASASATVCDQQTCSAPVSDPEALRIQLSRHI